ncbi:Potassium voltage-gated channel protein eag [Amphibalanus amphitrite]|uniref:Potassium voltage-gated channel protein eag n=1 Tax=Amphibalanus amphitrite TaxID=1232801 RepID=A0A6A4VXC0_AMPAM|nr:Potassium voltage-gated channel protein eag [Amphibalanus amphitrite]
MFYKFHLDLIFRKVSDVKREKELAERRKNDPPPDISQDHLVRKIFSRFKKSSDRSNSQQGLRDLEAGHRTEPDTPVSAAGGGGGAGAAAVATVDDPSPPALGAVSAAGATGGTGGGGILSSVKLPSVGEQQAISKRARTRWGALGGGGGGGSASVAAAAGAAAAAATTPSEEKKEKPKIKWGPKVAPPPPERTEAGADEAARSSARWRSPLELRRRPPNGWRWWIRCNW